MHASQGTCVHQYKALWEYGVFLIHARTDTEEYTHASTATAADTDRPLMPVSVLSESLMESLTTGVWQVIMDMPCPPC